MKPTDVLRHEHEVILMVLAAAEREASRIEEGEAPAGERIAQVVEFSRNFIDRCHHAKEEKHLFPMLSERSPRAAEGPLAVNADPSQLEQVLVNLALNAHEAMPRVKFCVALNM